MKILAGRAAEALPMIDRFIDKDSKDYDPALLPLLVDRARLSVALGYFDQAESEVRARSSRGPSRVPRVSELCASASPERRALGST